MNLRQWTNQHHSLHLVRWLRSATHSPKRHGTAAREKPAARSARSLPVYLATAGGRIATATPQNGDSDQLPACCGFFLCRLFRRHWPRRGDFRSCFFSSQISQPPFALISYSVLLSHDI